MTDDKIRHMLVDIPDVQESCWMIVVPVLPIQSSRKFEPFSILGYMCRMAGYVLERVATKSALVVSECILGTCTSTGAAAANSEYFYTIRCRDPTPIDNMSQIILWKPVSKW
jgi:hypothetical protein